MFQRTPWSAPESLPSWMCRAPRWAYSRRAASSVVGSGAAAWVVGAVNGARQPRDGRWAWRPGEQVTGTVRWQQTTRTRPRPAGFAARAILPTYPDSASLLQLMSGSRASLVWLFDVDGTLLLTKGAGREAMSLAFQDLFGIEDDLTSIPFAGRTDRMIFGDMLAKHGLELRDGERGRYWDQVAARMRTLMDPPRGGLLAGVRPLLETIGAEPGWVRALLTGNVAQMARIKL